MHQKDAEKLFVIVRELKENGNTVIMVDHNRDVMLKADHIIDIGPGAGVFGGKITAEGSARDIIDNPASRTGLYLARKKTISVSKKYKPDLSKMITMKGAKAHNLKNIDVTFPSGAILCICGVSGSGKSSLVEDCLYPAVHASISGNPAKNRQYEEIEGADIFSKIIFVDQKPITRYRLRLY